MCSAQIPKKLINQLHVQFQATGVVEVAVGVAAVQVAAVTVAPPPPYLRRKRRKPPSLRRRKRRKP